jgi:hypothetical protein
MNRLANAKLSLALLGCASVASAADFELGAYVQLPFFDKGETVFGLSAKPVFQTQFEQELSPTSDVHQAGLHVQTGPENEPVVTLNGVPLSRPQFLNQDGSSDSKGEQGIDWYLVAAAAIGIGLIAAVANSDSASVSACSGPNCPPEKPEPEEPEKE